MILLGLNERLRSANVHLSSVLTLAAVRMACIVILHCIIGTLLLMVLLVPRRLWWWFVVEVVVVVEGTNVDGKYSLTVLIQPR